MAEEAPLLDLSALDFAPAWVKGASADKPAPRPEHHEPRGPRPEKRGGFPGRRPPGRDREGFQRPRPGGKFQRPRQDERPAPPPNPFPWLRIAFTATPAAVETVVKQVRSTGKTFSLFDIARILLRNPASYTIDLSSAPKQPEGPFYRVEKDGSIWLSRDAAVQHVLGAHLGDFYAAEEVEVEAPKGNFSVVAVCGMSGTLLGPPNLHDYERRVRDLHRRNFSRMDFEHYRSRLKMVRDPEVIEKWRAAASKSVVYAPLGVEGAERLAGMAEVEKHFLAHHAAERIPCVAECSVPGDPRAAAVDAGLAPLLAFARDEEARFPLRLAQSLSRALSSAGLRFHKSGNRTTFVSGSRPRHLDLGQVVVSDSIRKILELIREKKSLRRGQLLDLLVPPPAAGPAVAPADPAVPPVEGAPANPPDPVRDAAMQDLLWLTHEGYVIEYADGRLESVPPPKLAPKPADTPAAPAEPQAQQPEA